MENFGKATCYQLTRFPTAKKQTETEHVASTRKQSNEIIHEKERARRGENPSLVQVGHSRGHLAQHTYRHQAVFRPPEQETQVCIGIFLMLLT